MVIPKGLYVYSLSIEYFADAEVIECTGSKISNQHSQLIINK
jgi:hypothetical protein